MRMNVIYDIAVLGWSVLDERSRTGVARVIENVAAGIAQVPGCRLRCGSSYGSLFGNKDLCLDYLKSHCPLKHCSKGFIDDLAKVTAYFPAKKNLCNVIKDKIFSNSPTIYHSPFYPIPEAVRREPHIYKVQTVYDLIPLMHPELFAEGDEHAIVAVLASLTPDMHIICISESTRNDFCSFVPQVDPRQVHVTHLAASAWFHPCQDEVAKIKVRQRYAIADGAHYLLSVCTLEPRKNVDRTIRSFVRLVKEQQIKDLYLVLTGTKGWDYAKILDEIDHAAEVMDRIILTGYVPDEELAPLYSGALAFVYPSIYEGFGLPPLEAMQCGTPVITSNTSSLPEVVGGAGIMIDPDDGDALCQAMLNLYLDADLREQLAQKSLLRAAQFSWEKCVAETVGVYQKAVAG